MSQEHLTKLTITAFSSADFDKPAESERKKFTVVTNPENFSRTVKIEWEEPKAEGTSSTNPTFKSMTASDLEISILFDGTGILQSTGIEDVDPKKIDSVVKQISDFEAVVFDYDGENHKPNHVIIQWGALYHKGVLSNISYEYKLFDPDGAPIRAIAKVTFKNAESDKLRSTKEKKSSPDLTHLRMVVAGDTLPNLSNKIYGDSKYYLEVAKANNLTNFRKLTPGQQLTFPPIDKIAK